ncbi:MAG: hypothetical protein K8U57_35805 [Planctomycetes bacterium]|nr:hypothetical protein [Planctomycetota bacterium]
MIPWLLPVIVAATRAVLGTKTPAPEARRQIGDFHWHAVPASYAFKFSLANPDAMTADVFFSKAQEVLATRPHLFSTFKIVLDAVEDTVRQHPTRTVFVWIERTPHSENSCDRSQSKN